MSKLKENKAFQTIVGGAVLYLLFILWRDGWIDAILRRNEDPEGFEVQRCGLQLVRLYFHSSSWLAS